LMDHKGFVSLFETIDKYVKFKTTRQHTIQTYQNNTFAFYIIIVSIYLNYISDIFCKYNCIILEL
jgi:hypothetical protein